MESEDKITEEPTPNLDYVYNFTIKKVTEDIDSLGFNTAISQMMIFINECYRSEKVNKEMLLNFIKLLSPIAPHVCEEIYHHYTGIDTLAYEPWPTYDESALVQNTIEIGVQVNGKVRGTIKVTMDADEEEVRKEALSLENVKQNIQDKEVRKVIYIKGKIVNIVAK